MTASIDRIASHQRTRSPSMPRPRRQETTPFNEGPRACTQQPAPTTRTQHSSLARRPGGLEITTPHPGDDQLSYPFRPLAAMTAAPREGRRAAHHLGPSVEGRTRVLSPPGTFTEVTPADRRIMVQAQSSLERARMPISRKPAQHLVLTGNTRTGPDNLQPAQLGVKVKGGPLRIWVRQGL